MLTVFVSDSEVTVHVVNCRSERDDDRLWLVDFAVGIDSRAGQLQRRLGEVVVGDSIGCSRINVAAEPDEDDVVSESNG